MFVRKKLQDVRRFFADARFAKAKAKTKPHENDLVARANSTDYKRKGQHTAGSLAQRGDRLAASAEELKDRSFLRLTQQEHVSLLADRAHNWQHALASKSLPQLAKIVNRALHDAQTCTALEYRLRHRGDAYVHLREKIRAMQRQGTISPTSALSSLRLGAIYIARLSSAHLPAKNQQPRQAAAQAGEQA